MAQSAHQIQKLSYKHHRIMDYMIANPRLRMGEIAKELGFSLSWMSIVVNTDLFKEELLRRRAAFNDENIRITQDRLASLGDKTLNAMEKKVDKANIAPDEFSMDELRKTAETVLKAQGMMDSGPKVTVNNNTQVVNNSVDEATFLRAKEVLNGKKFEQGATQNLPAPKEVPALNESP
jgi:hypothetical protein